MAENEQDPLKVTGLCEFEGCREAATEIAKGRDSHPGIHCYCEKHAETVADERSPEYIEHCLNCGCMFGVN